MKKLAVIQNNSAEKPIFNLHQVIDYVCDLYQIRKSQLCEKSRNHFNAKIRAIIAWLVVELKVGNITQVAAYFNREHSTLSRGINQIISFDHGRLEKIKKTIKNALIQA